MLHVWYLYVKFRVCKFSLELLFFLQLGHVGTCEFLERGALWEKMHRNKCSVFVLENTLKMDDH